MRLSAVARIRTRSSFIRSGVQWPGVFGIVHLLPLLKLTPWERVVSKAVIDCNSFKCIQGIVVQFLEIYSLFSLNTFTAVMKLLTLIAFLQWTHAAALQKRASNSNPPLNIFALSVLPSWVPNSLELTLVLSRFAVAIPTLHQCSIPQVHNPPFQTRLETPQ